MSCRLDVNNQPVVLISWGRKKWALGLIPTTRFLFAFPETRDWWAPVKAFTIRLLCALSNRSNNRNRVNSQSLTLVKPQ